MLTAEKYLKDLGIELTDITVIAYLEGAMRQPNLIAIMDGYAYARIEEAKIKDPAFSPLTKSLSIITSNGAQNSDGSIADTDIPPTVDKDSPIL